MWEQALAIFGTDNRTQYDSCSSDVHDVLKKVCYRSSVIVPVIGRIHKWPANTCSIGKVQEAIKDKKEYCVSKGRRIYRNKQDEEVKLRNVLEKISVRVDGIIKIINVGFTFDQSYHAALPWANL